MAKVKKHYPRGPSSAYRWMGNCHGSIGLCASLPPQEPGPAAAQGTHAHDIGERMLFTGDYSLHPEDDAEAWECAVQYAQWIDEHVRGQFFVREWIEETLESRCYEDFGGTADYAAQRNIPGARHLWIVDYKHGTRLEVKAEGNKQALCYALLFDELYGPFDLFTATFFQPRVRPDCPADSWEFGRDELRDAHRQMLDTVNWPSVFKPGTHCQYCPAQVHCKAFADEIDRALGLEPNNASVEQIEKMLDMLPAMRALVKNLPTFALQQMREGVEFTRWKPVRKYGHRRWNASDELIIATLEKHGANLDDAVEHKLKSPAQMEKAGLLDAVAEFVDKPDTGFAVVPVGDRRAAADLSGAPEDLLGPVSFAEEEE